MTETAKALRAYGRSVQETLGHLPWDILEQVAEALHQARLLRAQVFVAGNGGSAATASHMVNDLNKGANAPGVPRFRAIGLNDNIPLLMAWSNDTSYDRGLAEPLRNLARPGDLLVAFSCSGNSANIVEAAQDAQALGLSVIAFTGSPGGKLAERADIALRVPNRCTEQIEDVHMFLDHVLVSALRERATSELVPSLLLADGRGATPACPAVSPDVAPRPAILIDRDGVINANRADHVKTWAEFALLPGARDALWRLAALGLPIVVVTNQAAIAREQTTFDVVESINLRLMRLAAQAGARIDAVTSCPHHPDQSCGCRKPEAGMLTYAADSLRLDLRRSYLIGDALSDAQAAHAVGATPLLVRTGRGAAQLVGACPQDAPPCVVVDDLAAAATWIQERLAEGPCPS